MKFKKKPIIIEALQWNRNPSEFEETFGKDVFNYIIFLEDELSISTKEGIMAVMIGDWVIRGIAGEYYPCKSDIFEKTYEKVD